MAVGASLGYAEGFTCQDTDRHGRRLLALWGVERAQDHPDGRSTYTWTKSSYRWAASVLVRQVDTTSGTFVAAPDDPLPPALTTRCGGDFQPFPRGLSAACHAPGSGVGLALVAGFAGLHGGRVWVEPRDGGGASFQVLLPDSPEVASPADPPADPMRTVTG